MENMNNQYSNNTKIAWYIIVSMVSLLVLISLLGGCAITQETPNKCCTPSDTIIVPHDPANN
jgi:hypothetical protein